MGDGQRPGPWVDITNTYDVSVHPFNIWPGSDVQTIEPGRLEGYGEVLVVRRRRFQHIGDVIDILSKLVIDPGYGMPCNSLVSH